MRAAAVLSALSTCCPCGSYDVESERTADADALFHQDPRWLGGDGAYSIDLGEDRTLWLFGDSFIATSPALTRRESTLVRNSVAVMTGRDPLTAAMDFAWRDGAPPSSFFPEEGDRWYWPIHGVRTPDGPLVIFLARQRPTPGEGLGFAADGYRAVRVVDPSGPPDSWVLEPLSAPPVPDHPEATIGNCSLTEGAHLYALSVDDAHDARLIRYPLSALAAGDLTSGEWRTSDGYAPEAARTAAPSIVLEGAATECSLSRSDSLILHVASEGFGATSISVRSSDFLGDFYDPVTVFTPPESLGASPFVYAAKAHAHLADGSRGELLVTYVDNSFRFEDLLDPALEKTLYWPKFVRILFRIDC